MQAEKSDPLVSPVCSSHPPVDRRIKARFSSEKIVPEHRNCARECSARPICIDHRTEVIFTEDDRDNNIARFSLPLTST